MHKAHYALTFCAFTAGLVMGCDNDGSSSTGTSTETVDPGALISVSADGKIAVLLDEYPEAMRAKVADEIIKKPESFWTARAKDQMRLTLVRLNYRSFYYPTEDMKGQLPLPPEAVQRYTLDEAGAKRVTIDGHDMVGVDYRFQSYQVTTIESVELSEKALTKTGGTWDESIVLPLDPTLLLERTGYACMSEFGPPPGSVETENAYTFYDDTCLVELPTAPFCHYTQPGPDETCVEALDRTTGLVETVIHYERVAWDEKIADDNRVGAVVQPDYSDMAVRADALENNHIVYRYFPPDDCALEEKCVGGPGWRRLLMFDAVDENIGGKPLHVGAVDFYLAGGDTDNTLHGMYEYSACHEHYHFAHYGNFTLDGVSAAAGSKRGFCLISSDRLSNHELSPIYSPYTFCDYQGVEVGWGDTYQGGLACQWLDITDIGVKGAPVDATLMFHSNPDGFLCEGTPVLDKVGNQVWEATEFKTAEGKPVDRPKCDFFEGAEDNDIGKATVSIPQKGGVTTLPCQRNQMGPFRNCGFTEGDNTKTCTPGEQVKLSCSVADPSKPQIFRACDYSFAHGHGMACSAYDGRATKVIDGNEIEVSFTCPEKLDETELGGRYAIFTAPLWDGDGDAPVTCTPAQ